MKILTKRARPFGWEPELKAFVSNNEIKRLEIKKDVDFYFKGQERLEKASLIFEKSNKKDVIYSAQQVFAGHKFKKLYIKNDIKTVYTVESVDMYFNNFIANIISTTPSLVDIYEKSYEAGSKIFDTWIHLFSHFNQYLNYPSYKKINPDFAKMVSMFTEVLDGDIKVKDVMKKTVAEQYFTGKIDIKKLNSNIKE